MRKLNIASIVLSLVYSPLMLIKIYYSKAVLPGYDSDGNLITVTNIYRYSVLDNLSEMVDNGFGQFIVFFFILLCAILLSTGILCLIKKDNKELQLINRVLLILTSIIFVVLIIIGFTYIRCY